MVVTHIVLRVSNPAPQPFYMHSSLDREASRRLSQVVLRTTYHISGMDENTISVTLPLLGSS
jgi:hypothetical protein